MGHSHQRRGSGFGDQNYNIDVILIIVVGDGDDEMNKRETQCYLAKYAKILEDLWIFREFNLLKNA